MGTTNPFFDAGPRTGMAESPLPATAPKLKRSFSERVRRALLEEVQQLNLRLLIANLLVRLLPSSTFPRLRTAIYRLGGLRIGAHSLILGRLELAGSGTLKKRLRIGSNTIVNAHCFLDLNSEVHLGDWVSIGHHVTFITADHEVGPAKCRAGAMKPTPIVIGNGSWIGACSTILPGVSIGESSIVAAGSVVSGNVPPHKVVGGSPARALKALPSEP
jgi:maltose O-acetyltransferase